ncbi:hypothetical protein C447_12662 [Halococcus hamelinensis 100A6]|uniref:Uncharacterized protein n=1 Tax=Halococcus hamelinensis 100A6 TaxID=1132509 RepID=M0LVI0_9EURY|nr:hypothetical protein C447_12662 [Halococcus hamelinensis 100A6]
MLLTRKDGNCSVLDWDQGLVRVGRGEVTAGTTDTSGWSVGEEFSGISGSESTDGGELLKVVITADEGKRELIEEKE